MREASLTLELPALEELSLPGAYMARHSRSFRFATAFMAQHERQRLEHVYAWCRYADDLADDGGADPAQAAARLDRWLALSRRAYSGSPTGVAVIDRAMKDMAEHRVPFRYAEELVVGVRGDLSFQLFVDDEALRLYTHRVAGVVGQWLTELQGVRDRWMLERAGALGHAMQLTNILRDVGEDLDRGRVYLPLERLRHHGLTIASLARMHRGAPITAGYRALVDDLMAEAELHYTLAREAMPGLPEDFRRGVSVAAAVYEGILGEIRRNDYDNLRRRAATSTARKVTLAAGALLSSFFATPAQALRDLRSSTPSSVSSPIVTYR